MEAASTTDAATTSEAPTTTTVPTLQGVLDSRYRRGTCSDVRQRDVFVLHPDDPAALIQLESGVTIRGTEIWTETSDPIVLLPGERTVINTHVPANRSPLGGGVAG